MQLEQAKSEDGVVRLSEMESKVYRLDLGSSGERVVTFTKQRMHSLRETVLSLAALRPNGLIITGPSAEMFTAGADINLINEIHDQSLGESLAREGQDVFDLIEALACPVVAAISGPCVGGGCELALACKIRIISDHASSIIGLPETKLGIIPGFGGTQRLPRLVGLPRALDVILAGKTLRPQQALKIGLVDEIVPHEQIVKRAHTIITSGFQRKAQISFTDKLLTNTWPGRQIVRSKASKTIAKQSKGFYPALPSALEACLHGLANGKEAGLRYEARELGRLVVTPECKSLVKIFFLTEAAKGLGKAARKEVEHLDTLVIGSGTMGAGIAGVLAKNGASVTMKDTSDKALQRGLHQIRNYLGEMKYLSEAERSFIMNRIQSTAKDDTNLSSCKLVIEAVFEDMGVKKKVLSDSARQVSHDAILATNTSSLSVTELARQLENPQRVVGMHFFNPVEKMPLVEIVRGPETSDKTILVIAALTTKIGKFPIVVNDVPGFLVNRVLSAYLTEASLLLQEGYPIEKIDKAATDFGMPMGPFRLLDEVGLDVAAHVSKIMIDGYGERMRGADFTSKLVAIGRLGRKSKSGFYSFEGDKPRVTPEIRTLLGLTGPEKENADLHYLQDRLFLRLLNEAVLCLDEGVAGQPGREAANQIDLGTVMGIGFPPFRGGLMNYADSIGAKTIYEKLSRLHKESGAARYEPAPGVRVRAEKGINFHTALP